MNREKRSYPVIHVGTSFLLVIFIVLCLVVFAALSLSSALRDQSYVELEAQRTIAYYQANATAQEMLRDASQGSQRDRPSGSSNEIAFSIPIDELQTLEVEAVIEPREPEEPEGQTLRIVKWNKVNTSEWNANTTLPLLKADE